MGFGAKSPILLGIIILVGFSFVGVANAGYYGTGGFTMTFEAYDGTIVDSQYVGAPDVMFDVARSAIGSSSGSSGGGSGSSGSGGGGSPQSNLVYQPGKNITCDGTILTVAELENKYRNYLDFLYFESEYYNFRGGDTCRIQIHTLNNMWQVVYEEAKFDKPLQAMDHWGEWRDTIRTGTLDSVDEAIGINSLLTLGSGPSLEKYNLAFQMDEFLISYGEITRIDEIKFDEDRFVQDGQLLRQRINPDTLRVYPENGPGLKLEPCDSLSDSISFSTVREAGFSTFSEKSGLLTPEEATYTMGGGVADFSDVLKKICFHEFDFQPVGQGIDPETKLHVTRNEFLSEDLAKAFYGTAFWEPGNSKTQYGFIDEFVGTDEAGYYSIPEANFKTAGLQAGNKVFFVTVSGPNSFLVSQEDIRTMSVSIMDALPFNPAYGQEDKNQDNGTSCPPGTHPSPDNDGSCDYDEICESGVEHRFIDGAWRCDPTTKQGGCLIATATFGTELAPQVQMLREIRDNTLLQTNSGSSFMSGFNTFYYTFSPVIADWERQSPVFKEAVKQTITPLLSSLSILNYVEMDSEAEVLGYGISLILLNVGMYFVAPAVVIWQIKKRN